MTAQASPYSPRPALGCTDLSHRLPPLSERVRLDELADWNERNRLARESYYAAPVWFGRWSA